MQILENSKKKNFKNRWK